MKLKDIADMEDYLNDRCYCPYEIYDLSGFFFENFLPDTECELLSLRDEDAFVVVTNKYGKQEIIFIYLTDGKVDDCVRFDNTENNRKQVSDYVSGEIDTMHIDEYPETKTQESVEELLHCADFVCVS